MPDQFHVRIAKDELVFSAGHFITIGDECERLHGHNFRVTAEIFGPLDDNHYVVDFILVRDVLRAIVGELDHRMLLPTDHATMRVTVDYTSVEVTHADRRWVFPRADCALLPVPNTTAEMLARWIGRRLVDELQQRAAFRPARTIVAVDECFGQWGVCELTGD